MKHFFISILLISLSTHANCQLAKNTWLVGGAGSFYTYNEDYVSFYQEVTNKSTKADLSASIGHFFFDKLAGGVRPYFSTFKSNSSGGGYTNNYKIAIGPFVRYYFLDPEKPYNILADVGYQVGVNKNIGGTNSRGKYNIFTMSAGTEIFFNSSVGIEFLFGYSGKKLSIEDSESVINMSSNSHGFQMSIGFQLHLEKK